MNAPRFTRIEALDPAREIAVPGARLDAVRAAAGRARASIVATGVPDALCTYDLISFAYPTRHALGGATLLPLPLCMVRARLALVQWQADGRTKTLVFNPTDCERAKTAPYFRLLGETAGQILPANLLTSNHYTLGQVLADVALGGQEVDYVAFDRLHFQDLRVILGAKEQGGLFPNALLLLQRPELDALRHPHPLQDVHYVPGTLDRIDQNRIVALSGDYLIGPGVALVRTPGRTLGHQTLVLHTSRGVWTMGANGVALDNYAPSASHIPGVRRFAERHQVDVVPSGQSREDPLEQYTSMILEKALADPAPDRPEFPQHLPSVELVRHALAPGLTPTHAHTPPRFGKIVRGAV